ncbi:MAG: class I SAM-dependent methyltransferase [Candidatus Paceibacterota bacterium]|jgi:ubiquinone/menaquinone biosynthesis C-methylase UbiE
MNKKEFKNFFVDYAQNVDKANNSFFWRLSDDLIMSIIKDNIPKDLGREKIIFDAGGGTGRWVCMMSSIFKANFIVYDLSEEMLTKANHNIKVQKIEERVKLLRGDLIDIKKMKDESVDYVTSIYSPISFIDKPEKMAREIHRILKKGGKAIIMGHSFYNALASKINNSASLKDLRLLEKEAKVKWASHVPQLNTFSKETMEGLFKKVGFKIVKTHGVPVFVQPGPEDWDPENKKVSNISKALSDKKFYTEVFNLEKKYNHLENIANRGMNIISVFQK